MPFRETGAQDFCREGHARHMGVTLENGVELHNFYVPAGGDIPDPKANDKFAHKLHFLGAMEKFFARRKAQEERSGDPGGRSERRAAGERRVEPQAAAEYRQPHAGGNRLLGEALAAFDWTDVTRHFIPPEEKIYSWWSYRAADWEASDRGRRLDHVWVSPGLKGALKSHKIVKKMRGWQKASDHVPVMVEFAGLNLALLRHGPTEWNAAGPHPGPYRYSLER